MTDTIPEVLSKINERWENLTIADDFIHTAMHGISVYTDDMCILFFEML